MFRDEKNTRKNVHCAKETQVAWKVNDSLKDALGFALPCCSCSCSSSDISAFGLAVVAIFLGLVFGVCLFSSEGCDCCELVGFEAEALVLVSEAGVGFLPALGSFLLLSFSAVFKL